MTTPFNPNGSAFQNKTNGRGFAGMTKERQREIASMGGRAAHASGNAHQFTSEEARAAGRKRYEKRYEKLDGAARQAFATLESKKDSF